MSEHNADTDIGFAEGADLLTDDATFDGVVEVNGQRLPIRVREPKLGELEELEAGLPDDAEDVDVAREMVDEFLVKPDIDPSTLGVTRAMSLFLGMRETWEQAEAFERAREELQIEGNR
jgi:hypothetical protein